MPDRAEENQSISARIDSVILIIQDILTEMNNRWAPITRDTRMDTYFKEVVGADSIEYLDLSFRIEKRFGIMLSRDDWKYLTGEAVCKSPEDWEAYFGGSFTFGRIAEIIIHRCTLTPITILGSKSAAAGAFRCVQGVANQVSPRIKPFGPSTPILERLRGRSLERFWTKLQIISGEKLPRLARGPIGRVLEVLFDGITGATICLILYGLIVWGFFVLLWPWIGHPAVILAIFIGAVLVLVFASMSIRYVETHLRGEGAILPYNITTFRDLAELISEDRGGWCEKCGYDLTGLTSERCPECGRPIQAAPLSALGTSK